MSAKGLLSFCCPNCREVIQAAPRYAGLALSCSRCGTLGNIPYELDRGVTPVIHAVGDPPLSSGSFQCPDCQQTLGHDPDLAGVFVLCPFCGTQFRMPDAEYSQPNELFGLPGPTRTLQGIRKQILQSGSTFYVYALCKPDGQPFYIGKGIANRVAAHESEALQKKRNTPKHLIIRDAKRQGLRIGYKLLGTFESEKEAICAEQDFIRRYGRLDRASGVLVNLSDGGEGYVEKYFSERWKTDENGIRLVEATAVPTDEDLVAPRFSSHNDLITETNAAGQVLIIGKRKPAEWSGPEMPLIAQWQGHGLTVQVFFAGSEKHDIQTWISMPWRDELNVPIAVRFRVFDGCRRILEDRTAFFLECFGRELCSPRASEPSPERLVAEGLLVAAILRRLADLGKEIESASPENRVRPRSAVTIRQNGPWRGRNRRSVGFPRPGLFRFDLDYGTRTFTKRLQAWVKYNSDSLRLIAVEIETKSKAPCEGG